jgi:hypothetical protein
MKRVAKQRWKQWERGAFKCLSLDRDHSISLILSC